MRWHGPTLSRNRFVPYVQALEDRSVPTILLSLSGPAAAQQLIIWAFSNNPHAVQIIDDPLNNRVTISSPELAGASQTFQNQNIVAVTYNGSFPPNFNVNEGTNFVTYFLVSDPGASHTVTFNGGPKNDLFIAQVSTDLHFPAKLTITANGEGGNNILALSEQGNLFQNASLSFNANGGNGHNTEIVNATGFVAAGASFNVLLNNTEGTGDTAVVNYQGEVFSGGLLDVVAFGGPGKDTLVESLQLSPNSMGTVSAFEFGFGGDDFLKLDIRQQNAADHPIVFAFMDGGSGFNTGESNLFPPFTPAGYNFTDVHLQKHLFDL